MEAYKQRGNDGFWKMHDTLFANQKTPDGLKRPALEQYASDEGLDMNRFRAALDHSSHAAEIDADAKSAADARINGAPRLPRERVLPQRRAAVEPLREGGRSRARRDEVAARRTS